jgi:hypothetical protein
MVLDRCTIIGTGGVDFGIETAEVNGFAVITYTRNPFAGADVEGNADVTRPGFFSCFSSVEHIFRGGSEAEIGPAIIEAVIISVVNEKAGRRVQNKLMQILHFSFAAADSEATHGVEGVIIPGGTPFEGVQEGVVVGVNDGEFAPGKGYDADVAAEANAMIHLNGPKQNFFEV